MGHWDLITSSYTIRSNPHLKGKKKEAAEKKKNLV